MRIIEYILMSLRDLGRRKGRTILTCLGITIGTLLIVTMVGLGTGLKDFISSLVNSNTGSKSIYVQPLKYYTDEDVKNADMKTFREDYFKKIDDNIIKEVKDTGKIESVSAFIRTNISAMELNGVQYSGSLQVLGFNLNENIYSKSQIREFRNTEKDESLSLVKEGRMIKNPNEILITEAALQSLKLKPSDVLNKQLVIPIDKINKIKIANPITKTFTIVGIVDKRVDSSKYLLCSDKDAGEIKGTLTMQKDYLQNKGYDQLQIIVKKSSDVEAVSKKIKTMGYYYTSTVDMAKKIDESLSGFSTGFTILGVIVLVVAAINIINTMSMAVIERTKSIGVMKSVGADATAIRTMFLVQSAIIGFLGSGVGILLAWGINSIIEHFINNYISSKSLSVTMSVGMQWYFVLSVLGFSIIISLVSGIYPAIKASKLDPIEALRR